MHTYGAVIMLPHLSFNEKLVLEKSGKNCYCQVEETIGNDMAKRFVVWEAATSIGGADKGFAI